MANKTNNGDAKGDAKGNAAKKSKSGKKTKAARKRNSADLGMRVLKMVGAVLAGAAVAVGGMMLLSATSLSAAAQDGILIAGGIVLGGGAFAMGYPNLGTALAAAPTALGLSRRVLAWGITSRAAELLSSVSQATNTATTPTNTATTPTNTTPSGAAFFGGAPAGYLSATPSWAPNMAQGTMFGQPFANMTTPMAGYG